MNTYTVVWVLEVEAANPEEAALKALQVQRDEESQALAFDVTLGESSQFVDLAPKDPPKAEKGAYVVELYNAIWGDLECHFDYSKGSRGSYEGGLQMEPDEPESCDLYAAYWQGHDVSNLLIDAHKADLEEIALYRMTEDAADDFNEPDDDDFYAGAI